MLKKISDFLRALILILLALAAMFAAGLKLMKIQVVDGAKYLIKEDVVYKTHQVLNATRGEIVDANGNRIVGNAVGFNVYMQKAFLPRSNADSNAVIAGVIAVLEENGVKWNDRIPITFEKPYEYSDSESAVKVLKNKININSYATAENCVDKLIDMYKIADGGYDDITMRKIAGIRYEMLAEDFSLANNFLFAEDVPYELAIKLKEMSVILKGVTITETPSRKYYQPDFLPHEIGVVSKIYAEDYAELKAKGYAMNDRVGKGGLEEGMEDLLKGKKGEQEITFLNGEVISTEAVTPAEAGNTIKLTVKPEFQYAVQEIMANHMSYLRTRSAKYNTVNAAATVVLDVKTGAVLALGTLPTYSMTDYTENYAQFMEDIKAYGSDTPLINRATDGLYRPGSTFKTITATAGLNERIIAKNSTFYCGHTFHYSGINVNCTGFHSNIAVTHAITVSCNIFFYNLGLRLGVDKLSEYENMYGLGTRLGLESGDSEGWIANPATFEKKGWDWSSGLLLQAAIGQSEVAVTPLQMATVGSTIANRGTRLKPHIVDTVYDYTMDNAIEQKGRETAFQFDVAYPEIYDYIWDGMIGAARNTPAGEFSLNGLGYTVAIKTGTPQTGHINGTSSSFVGFAPVEDPQIAFFGIYEGGEYSKYTIRKILDAYQEIYKVDFKGTAATY